MKKKFYILYLAVTIWKMHEEINRHLEIAAKNSKEDFSKHFDAHLCNIQPMNILMKVIETWFPEIYQFKGKSIKQHYVEAEQILKDNFFGKPYKKLR